MTINIKSSSISIGKSSILIDVTTFFLHRFLSLDIGNRYSSMIDIDYSTSFPGSSHTGERRASPASRFSKLRILNPSKSLKKPLLRQKDDDIPQVR